MDNPEPVPPRGLIAAVGPTFEPLTSLTASQLADMGPVELGEAPAAAATLPPGPPRGPIDIGELHAAAEVTAAADLRTDPQWQGNALAALAGQLTSGHPTPTSATRSLPRGLTRPPRTAGR